MLRQAAFLLQLSVVAGLLAPRVPHQAIRSVVLRRQVHVVAVDPSSDKSPEEALAEAAAKLEQLEERFEAPKSYADLGLKSEVPEPPQVPGFITAAPPILIAFAGVLVVLNNLGTFGEGPDLDAFVQWADSL